MRVILWLNAICLFVTVGLFAGQTDLPGDSPREVLQRFCELDLDGAQLDAKGWREVANFFMRPAFEPPSKIVVASSKYGVSEAKINELRAKLYVQALEWGEIDESLEFIPATEHPIHPIPVRSLYTLYFTDTHWERQSDGTSTKRTSSHPEWRIEGSPAVRTISVETAIRYVTRLSEESTNAKLRQNAKRSVARLQGLGERARSGSDR